MFSINHSKNSFNSDFDNRNYTYRLSENSKTIEIETTAIKVDHQKYFCNHHLEATDKIERDNTKTSATS